MIYKKRAVILVLALGLGLAPSSFAAGTANPVVVEQPAPPHHFLDAANIGLQAIGAALMAADVATTHRALQVPGTHEMNPLAQSQGALIALKFAAVGASAGVSYMLHKSGHHKAERLVPLFLGIPSGAAAIHNAGIHH